MSDTECGPTRAQTETSGWSWARWSRTTASGVTDRIGAAGRAVRGSGKKLRISRNCSFSKTEKSDCLRSVTGRPFLSSTVTVRGTIVVPLRKTGACCGTAGEDWAWCAASEVQRTSPAPRVGSMCASHQPTLARAQAEPYHEPTARLGGTVGERQLVGRGQLDAERTMTM